MKTLRVLTLFSIVVCLVCVWAGAGRCGSGTKDQFRRDRDGAKEEAAGKEAVTEKPAEEPGEEAGEEESGEAQDEEKTPAEKEAEVREKEASSRADAEAAKLPVIKIDVKGRKVTLTARVCLTDGILEYLLVAAGGKEYESVFATPAKPSDVHLALLAVGANTGVVDKTKGAAEKSEEGEAAPTKEGTRFDVSVAWVKDGKAVSYPAGEFLFDREKDQSGGDLQWAFTGSLFYTIEGEKKERYLADEDGSIVATYYDGGAILNLSRDTKDPYRGENFGFEVNSQKIPPKGTTVLMTFAVADKR